MKRLIIIAALLALPAYGATWSVTTNANQETRFNRDRLERNAQTCMSLGLATSCTLGQARAAYCAKPGSSSPTPPCTVNGVSSTTIVVMSDVGQYLDWFVVDSYWRDLKVRQDEEDRRTFAAWLTTASAAQKDAVCAAAGLSAGCLP